MTDLVNSQKNLVNNLKVCRICGQESEHGEMLFYFNQDIQKLAVKICSFLSIRLNYVRIYPNWICPGCHLQFETTKQFFDLILNGQRLLTERFGIKPRIQKRPKRRKTVQTTNVSQSLADVETREDGRKRLIKTPGRLQDSMQGNELENLYAEMGVTRNTMKENKKSKKNLIAHIKSSDGKILGEMLSFPQNPQRTCTRYQCDICKETFIRDVAFFKHVASHNNILYECTECEQSFPSKVLFDEHQVKKNHKGLGIIEQPPTYDENTVLNNGTVEPSTSPLAKRFVCSKCFKSFGTKMSMKRHQVTHSQDRPYKCDICPAAFKLSSILSIHKITHTGERSFKCEKCQMCFSHRQTLKVHLRSHDGLKPYMCSICKKSFPTLGTLKEHKRIHTGEKPYVCLICGTAFRTSSQCQSHQKIHTNRKTRPAKPITFENVYKSHNCSVCGKLFSQRSAMIKHLRTHTGEKPYVCHLCPKSFADPSNFKKHKRVHFMQSEKRKAKSVAALKQNLTQVSSNSDPDPDGLLSINSLPSENLIPPSRSLIDILDEDNDRNSKTWGLLRESSDPIITEIHADESSLMQPQQSVANQLVWISYQDPMNPVSSKTTFYVVK